MIRKARIIITEVCHRKCPGCCNNYSRIMASAKRVKDITEIRQDFDEVMITGGEPLLLPRKILTTAAWFPRPTKIYLYTTAFLPRVIWGTLLPVLDGVQFSLHYPMHPTDHDLLRQWQDLLARPRVVLSGRLWIDQRITDRIIIQPDLWQRVTIGPWKTEEQLLAENPNNGLPEGEELYILG